MKTIPDKWVVISLSKEGQDEPETYKVFASWAGGYLRGDSWRLNSGIQHVYEEEDAYRFSGYSGSSYVCHKNCYGIMGTYNKGVLDNMIERAKHVGATIKILPADYKFELINS